MRRVALLLLALVAAGGGGAREHGTATLWVTRDRGAHVLYAGTVPAGLTAMQALDRKRDITTRYGGRFVQSIELPGHWLERASIAADDARLLDSPLGWGGRRVLATMWFASGDRLAASRREALLAAAREVAHAHPLGATSGSTAPHDDVVVLRALADRVEPAMALLQTVWRAWRPIAWGLEATLPRVWAT